MSQSNETNRTDVTQTPIIQEDLRRIGEEMEQHLRPLRGSTLLVTGGGGFLCSWVLDIIGHLNREAWTDPCKILCVDNLRTGTLARIAHLSTQPWFRFIQHDIAQPWTFDDEPEFLIHGASIASPTYYRQYPLETIDANVSGVRHMLDLARKSKSTSMAYLSTSEIYGDPTPDMIPTPETYRGFVSCTGPRACYDESKRLSETLCWVYHSMYGVPVKAVRPFNVFGPGQRLDDKRIVPDLMTAVLQDKPITLLSDGSATRSYCYAPDAARALLYVLMSDRHGEPFNIGNDEEEISVRGLAERLLVQAGKPLDRIQYAKSEDAQYLTDNPQRRRPDLTKLRQTSWRPHVSLDEALRRTYQSYAFTMTPAEAAIA